MSASLRRDYKITGSAALKAKESGLAAAEWYESPIERKRFKELMRRKDGPAIRDTLIWFSLLAISGIVAYHLRGSWLAVPAFFVYGTLYASPADSRWHECGHGTAFKTPWMNEIVYQIASFMFLRPATAQRWSHIRHHTDTIIVGRDAEILTPRPPIYWRILMQMLQLWVGSRDVKRSFLHCFGKFDEEELEYLPKSQQRKASWEARVYVLVLLGAIVWSIDIHSMLPLLYIGLPSFYGSLLPMCFILIQHTGLYEDVLDHRLNTRTVYLNPVFRFLYLNMNHHVEHHMFPMIPYYNLPALHEEMKRDCPTACPSLLAALKEVIFALRKQAVDPNYVIRKELPSTANQYKYGPKYDSNGILKVRN